MKKFKTNKRLTFTLIAVAVLIVAALAINAYNSGGPSSQKGHQTIDIVPSWPCSANQIIKRSSTQLGCSNPPVLGGSSGYVLRYANSNTFTSSRIFQNQLGNVGINTITPREKLDVQGDIHVTGTICSDIDGCIGSSSGSNGDYTVSGPYTTTGDLGAHSFCYLSRVDTGYYQYDCSVVNSGMSNGVPTWYFNDGASRGNCEVYCIDGGPVVPGCESNSPPTMVVHPNSVLTICQSTDAIIDPIIQASDVDGNLVDCYMSDGLGELEAYPGNSGSQGQWKWRYHPTGAGLIPVTVYCKDSCTTTTKVPRLYTILYDDNCEPCPTCAEINKQCGVWDAPNPSCGDINCGQCPSGEYCSNGYCADY